MKSKTMQKNRANKLKKRNTKLVNEQSLVPSIDDPYLDTHI